MGGCRAELSGEAERKGRGALAARWGGGGRREAGWRSGGDQREGGGAGRAREVEGVIGEVVSRACTMGQWGAARINNFVLLTASLLRSNELCRMHTEYPRAAQLLLKS